MLKDYFIIYKSRIALKKNLAIRENPTFQEAKNIGIIFTWEGDEKVEIIQNFVNELKISGKKSNVLCFYKNKDEIPQKTYKYFTSKDFNQFGSLKSDTIYRFINTKFDFLFHLDTQKNLYIEYILAYSQTKCRVSRFDFTRKDFYDFMIKTGDNEGIEQLCKQILHYTKSLVKHE